MGYDNQPRSSSVPVVAIVLLLIFMVLGGLVVVGVGGWFFLARTRVQQEVAMEQRERAIQAEELARAMAKEAEAAAEAARSQAVEALKTAAEFEEEVVNKTASDTQFTVELDQDGNLKLNSEAIELPALMDRLKALAADKTVSVTVNVRADSECPFEQVVSVISSCQELGITRFRFGTLNAAIAEDPSEDQEPATVIE